MLLVSLPTYSMPRTSMSLSGTLAGHLGFITSTPQDLAVAREWVVTSASDDDDDDDVGVEEDDYTLEALEDYKFKFPDPSLLEGVKTKEKSLLEMHKVGFVLICGTFLTVAIVVLSYRVGFMEQTNDTLTVHHWCSSVLSQIVFRPMGNVAHLTVLYCDRRYERGWLSVRSQPCVHAYK